MTVLIYLRSSTPDQPNSHAAQRRVIALALGEQVMRRTCVIEEKRSGHLNDIFDFVTRRTEGVVVYDVSRFSRSYERGAAMLDRLLRSGIWVRSVSDNIYVERRDTPEYYRFLQRIQDAANESMDFSRRIRDTNTLKLSRGEYCGGRLPYGLGVMQYGDKKYFVVEEKEMQVISLVSSLRSEFYYRSNIEHMIAEIIGFPPGNIIEYDAENEFGEYGNKPMTYADIAFVLGYYGVRNREGNKFAPDAVRRFKHPEVLRNYVKANINDMFINDINELQI